MFLTGQADIVVRIASCDRVRLSDGQTVVGNWGERQKEIYAHREGLKLLEQFVNVQADKPQEILQWTKKFGPLRYPPVWMKEIGDYVLGIQSDGREFPSFTIERWRQDQLNTRREWQGKCGIGELKDFLKHSRSALIQHRVVPTEEVWFREGRIEAYLVADLLHFLDVSMDACIDRLRVCANRACKVRGELSPTLFIAEHNRQRFCSDDCSTWNRRQIQQRYLRRRGKTRAKSGRGSIIQTAAVKKAHEEQARISNQP